ncbi:PA14 domain-containing protein [Streptomyces sp. MI02-7b]|uniref:PA14 domain-containing protein n=1 Tax=Streptomyces sp. MI02-7b TaxID=462941 RepID=UPI0029BE0EF6|nr:PA14 domain-containing protein [Streptomyces sp. MI02-7b]MDX3076327.1 PA14 domain-containing protein [Streptomyces sp. MI02-7b]
MSSVGRSRLAAGTAVVVALTGGLVAVATSQAGAATSCATNAYTRQFFANTGFSGAVKRTDCDTAINENWGGNSPGVSGVGKDNFGVRWSVKRDFGSGGPFAFSASGQDGIRVYLDGARKVDLWKNGTSTVSKTVNLTIPKGTHTLRVDYVNWTGSAAVKFAYTPRNGATVDRVAPLTPTGPSIARNADTKRNVLRWSANKEMDVAGYRVYRRTPDQASFGNPIATVTSTGFTDTTAGTTTHLYEVRAVDRSGNVSAGTADVSVAGNPAYLRQYFANTSLTGTPKYTDTDTAISENWGGNAPAVSGVGKDNFGVRWQITRDFGSGGPFAFSASGQDGIRVYLDGVRKIDLWKNGTSTVSKTVNLTIPKGTHTLRVDYVNWTGNAAVKFAYAPLTSASVDHVAPLAPTGSKVVYNESADSATLTWAPSKEMDRAYYWVYRQTAWGDWGAPRVVTDKTTWTSTGLLRDGEPVNFMVRVTDRAGNVSEGTPVLTVTPVDTVAPAAPVLSVTHESGTASSLRINWALGGSDDEVRGGGTLKLYRSTGDTLGDDPELVTTVSAASPSVSWHVDDLPAFDGTSYTYGAVVSDAAGNVSPMSLPVTVTPDRVPPPALTGLTASPRADGVVLSWDTPAESGLRYVAARVVRRADGSIHYDNTGCYDATPGLTLPGRDVPNALLCVGPPDGETVTFFVAAMDRWDNHIAWASAPTVTITEPDNRPDDARGEDTGPLTIVNPTTVSELGYVQWTCDDAALCAGITEYQLDKWNPSTRAYERFRTVPSSASSTLYKSYVPMPQRDTTYFRITGVLADGTVAAVTHGAGSHGVDL